MEAFCLADFEERARGFLPHALFSYVYGGVETDLSLRLNRAAFDQWVFRPRSLANVAQRDMQVEIFGRTYAAPFGVAPMGGIALGWTRGDVALAEAAGAENIPFLLSGASCAALEKVREAGPHTWFQAYLPAHEKTAAGLVERVTRAGYEVLVVTVDVPVVSNREHTARVGFSMPLRPSMKIAWDGLQHPRWLLSVFLKTLLVHGMPYMENFSAKRGVPVFGFAPRRSDKTAVERTPAPQVLTWASLEAVRRQWKGKLVIKGLLTAEDARRAADMGADGIIVSNHGGRQLDGAIAALHALPAVVAAVPNLTVMMDGGVQRGTHVLKALALGARCVFLGRPMFYAVASGGVPTARKAMGLLASEIDRDMALLGISRLSELDASFVTRA